MDNGVYLYRNDDFNDNYGNNEPLKQGNYKLRHLTKLGVQNDSICSIKIIGNYAVEIFASDQFMGESALINESISDLNTINFYKRISSIKIHKIQKNTNLPSNINQLNISTNSQPQIISNPSNSEFYNRIVDTSISLRIYSNGESFIGSGFVFKHNGNNPGLYIGTCAHCIMTGTQTRDNIDTEIYVTIYNFNKTGKTRVFKCNVVGIAGYADFAVLELIGDKLITHNYLEFETSDENCKIGDKAFICGNPLGKDAVSFCEGSIRDNSYWFEYMIEMICFSTPTYGGNSGSAVLNSDGKIIGIISYSMNEGDNFNFGCKYNHLNLISQHICNSGTNFIGGYIYARINPIEIIYLKHFNRLNREATGFYVYNVKHPTLKTYEGILKLNDKKIGIYPNESRPSDFYMLGNSTVNIESYDPYNNKITNKTIRVYSIPATLDVYINHPEQAKNNSYDSNINVSLIGPLKTNHLIKEDNSILTVEDN